MKNNTEIDVDQYAVDFTKVLLKEVVSLIEIESKRLGKEFKTTLSMTLLSSLICTLIFNQLKNSALEFTNQDDKYKQYKLFKSLVEQSVAIGFQSAMEQFAGGNLEYFCQVLPVPEAVNKEPC